MEVEDTSFNRFLIRFLQNTCLDRGARFGPFLRLLLIALSYLSAYVSYVNTLYLNVEYLSITYKCVMHIPTVFCCMFGTFMAVIHLMKIVSCRHEGSYDVKTSTPKYRKSLQFYRDV
ncbi:hypothetical protein NPIL_158661 [Nephila pilipes]|uniref:Uncharacterized protein n=1 Tax=Nephila pilipes TaxID=299642 RepID=A0A8X6PMU7_NEPPI|nr:hypothetical protein NPIL_158661 [Nephila pilipes]